MPKFTRRHYKDVAGALAKTRPGKLAPTSYSQWLETREELALTFKKDNSSFNREKFFEATEKDELTCKKSITI